MKKLLLFLFLICCLPAFAQPSDDTVASETVEDTPANSATTTVSLAGQGAATDTVGNGNNDAVPEETITPYPDKEWGREVGLSLIAIICLLCCLLLLALRDGKFNLKEALSENANEMMVVKNEEYARLPEIIISLTDANNPRFLELASQAKKDNDDLATKMEAYNKAVTHRDKVIDPAYIDEEAKAKAIAAAVNAAYPDEETKKQAIEKAENDNYPDAATRDTMKVDAEDRVRVAANDKQIAEAKAQVSTQALAALTLSPTMLANLRTLFPPTIEKTKTAADGTTPEPSYRPSASRFIAFISAMLLLIVGIAATCFFLYYYLVVGIAPDLSKLSAILIALGIGMAPYAINKVANAASDKDKTI